MTENTRHETPDVAELRRLAEAATPGPWEAFGAVDGRRGERWLGVTTDMRAIESARAGDVFAAQNCTRQDALFIAAANPAVMLALLDAAAERDEIAGRLAHLLCDLTGGRMSKTSYPVPVMAQEIEQYLSECHESDLKDERDALAAAVERVRALHQAYVCEECREDPSGGACREDPSCEACDSMSWPCPTIRAIGGES